jgi:dipeptidyl aminopeptidase/acylaminoacyl peptidase
MKKFVVIAIVLFFAVNASTQTRQVNLSPYLSIRGAGAPSLSPNGEWIAFTSGVSGTSQIWLLPAKATSDGRAYWPEQLTFYPDAVGGASWSPDGKWILFSKDIGGNERRQMYLLPAKGGEPDTLTNNPKAIHGGGFSHDGKSIVFQSNSRNEAYFDIYKMDLATRQITVLHQSDHQNGLVALSPNNRWLIFQRDSGNSNEFVYIKDLWKDKPTDEARLLIPHSTPANFSGYHISLDNKRLYFFTNLDREFSNRAYVELESPSPKVIYRENVNWDIDQSIFDEEDKIEVVTRNVNGMSELRIFDAKSGKELKAPKLPEGGFISNLQVSRGGNKIAFNFTSPTEPGAIFVFDRKKNKLERVTQPNLAGLEQKSFVTSRFITYPSFDGKQIPAYFYEAKTSSRAPVIVMMHGGPESQDRPWFNPLAQYYVARGYHVLVPNVRGSTGYGKSYSMADNTTNRLVSVRDMEYAGHWLNKQPNVDPDKKVIYGGSYGGFMSLAAMTMQSDMWAAGVNLFGIANFHSFLRNTGAWRAANRMAEYGHLERDSAFLLQISPLTHVQNIKKPLFVYQGKNDPRVPYTEAEQIVEAVKAKGIPVEYILLEDEGHGLAKRENRIRVTTAIVDFLDRVLNQ